MPPHPRKCKSKAPQQPRNIEILPKNSEISSIVVRPRDIHSPVPQDILLSYHNGTQTKIIGGHQIASFLNSQNVMNFTGSENYKTITNCYKGLDESWGNKIETKIAGRCFYPFNFSGFKGQIGETLTQKNTEYVQQGEYAITDKNSEKHILATAWCDNCVGLLMWCKETGMAMLTHIDPIAWNVEATIEALRNKISGHNSNNKVHVVMATSYTCDKNNYLSTITKIVSDQNKYIIDGIVNSSKIAFNAKTGCFSIANETMDNKITEKASYKNMVARDNMRYEFRDVPYLYPTQGTENLELTKNFSKDFCECESRFWWRALSSFPKTHQNIINLVLDHLQDILEYKPKPPLKTGALVLGDFFRNLNKQEQLIFGKALKIKIEESEDIRIKLAANKELMTRLCSSPVGMKLQFTRTLENKTIDEPRRKFLAEQFVEQMVQNIASFNDELSEKLTDSYTSITQALKTEQEEKIGYFDDSKYSNEYQLEFHTQDPNQLPPKQKKIKTQEDGSTAEKTQTNHQSSENSNLPQTHFN